MKRIFIAGLQRSGTNYAECLLNYNIYVDVFWNKFENKDTLLWKHKIIPLQDDVMEKYNISGILLVIKNPYSWIESICNRNSGDLILSYNYLYQLTNTDFELTTFNIKNLIQLYKDFYTTWLSKDVFLLRYEDLLISKECVINEFIDKYNLKLRNVIQDYENPIPESLQFDEKIIEKYKNVELSFLKEDDISTINEVLGISFFNKIGYKML
jgi:hypothetical protein